MSRIVHFEIQGNEPEALSDFYRDVLGWEITLWAGPQKYWLASTGPDSEAGINGAIMERRFAQQAVINTAEVENLDATLAAVEAAGGRRLSEPNQIPGVGAHAYCADPEGNVFGVLQSVPKST